MVDPAPHPTRGSQPFQAFPRLSPDRRRLRRAPDVSGFPTDMLVPVRMGINNHATRSMARDMLEHAGHLPGLFGNDHIYGYLGDEGS